VTSTFDDLSKTLAGGVSRRDVLRLIGGSIGGTVLATIGVGEAQAATSSCAAYCANFHGAAHAQCMQTCKRCGSDTSRLCAGFGPGGGVTCCPGPGPVTCCSGPNGGVTCCPSGSNCCFNGSGTTICCPSGTFCCGGPTNSICCDSPSGCCFNQATGQSFCCPSGQVCCGGPTPCCTPGTAGCCV
jgi:hypothetical protein